MNSATLVLPDATELFLQLFRFHLSFTLRLPLRHPAIFWNADLAMSALSTNRARDYYKQGTRQYAEGDYPNSIAAFDRVRSFPSLRPSTGKIKLMHGFPRRSLWVIMV